jgi:hypothetical protein
MLITFGIGINYEALLLCSLLHPPVTSCPSGTNILTSHEMTQGIIASFLDQRGSIADQSMWDL